MCCRRSPPAAMRCGRRRRSASPRGRKARRPVSRGALDEVAARGATIVPALRQALLTGLEQRLAALGDLIQAKRVTLASLPAELRDSWIAADGRARVEVFPQGDARDPDVLDRFVAAVRTHRAGRDRHAGDDPRGRPSDQLGLCPGRDHRRRRDRAPARARAAPAARRRARDRPAAARRDPDPGDHRGDRDEAQLRQHHRLAAAAWGSGSRSTSISS